MPQFRADIGVTSKAVTEAQGILIGTQTSMPQASIYNVGCTVKYVGSAGTYTPGCYYTCVQSGDSYLWQKSDTIATGLEVGTANRAMVTDSSGRATASSTITATELGYLDGVTGNIQTQLNDKVPDSRTINDQPLSSNITFTLSDFQNDTGFITSTVSNLTNYYTKSNTYTRTEIQNLISDMKSASFSVVSSLPSSGEAGVIYLVPKSGTQTNNVKDEYIWVNNAWEKIGDTTVDLSNYYTKAEVNSRDVSSVSWSSNALRVNHSDGTYDSATPSGAASTIMTSALTANRALVSNASGKVAISAVTSTELSRLDGVTSNIQTQLDGKVPTSRTINGHPLTSNITLTSSDLDIDIPEVTVTANRAVVSNSSGALTASAVTSTEIGYLDGVTGNIQTQLNGKASSGDVITGGTFSTTQSGNLTLTLNRTAGALNIGPTALTAARAVADGNGANIASTYATQSALSNGLAGKADADDIITGGAFSNNTLTLNKVLGDIEINAPFVEQTELSQYALKNMQITNVTYNDGTLVFYRPIGNIELNVRFPSGEPLVSNVNARVSHTSGDIILTITWTVNTDEIGDLTAEMDASFSATYSRANLSNTYRDSFSAYHMSNATLRTGYISVTFEILSGMITVPINNATLVSLSGTFTFSDDTTISFSV